MSNYASMKFKELDVEKEHLWIMLFNSIILENLTIFCILTANETNLLLYVKTDVAWLSTILIL